MNVDLVPNGNDQTNHWMEQAISKGAEGVAILKELIAMRNQESERIAKAEFDKHFAEMQKEYTAVGRGKSAKQGERELYKYCPLEMVLAVYAPIISRHGFAFRWENEAVKEGSIRVWCIVSGYGFEKRSYVDMPIGNATSFSNSAQQYGSATSYGKRYSFINAFAVIIAEEDDDASSSDLDETLCDWLFEIENASSIAELQKNFTDAWKHFANDKTAQAKISAAKDMKKREFSNGTA
jgi:hypothetical protein